MNVLFRGTEIPIRETDTKVKEVGSEIRNGMYGRLGRLPWWLRWQRICIKVLSSMSNTAYQVYRFVLVASFYFYMRKRGCKQLALYVVH